MAKVMVQFNVRLPPTVIAQLKEEAHIARVPLAEYVRSKLSRASDQTEPEVGALEFRVAELEAWRDKVCG